jgi:hypothetical protein
MKKRGSYRFWLVLGIIFILLDPVLAHLCNANIISWPKSLDTPAITRTISQSLIGIGLLFIIIYLIKSKKYASKV